MVAPARFDPALLRGVHLTPRQTVAATVHDATRDPHLPHL